MIALTWGSGIRFGSSVVIFLCPCILCIAMQATSPSLNYPFVLSTLPRFVVIALSYLELINSAEKNKQVGRLNPRLKLSLTRFSQ